MFPSFSVCAMSLFQFKELYSSSNSLSSSSLRTLFASGDTSFNNLYLIKMSSTIVSSNIVKFYCHSSSLTLSCDLINTYMFYSFLLPEDALNMCDRILVHSSTFVCFLDFLDDSFFNSRTFGADAHLNIWKFCSALLFFISQDFICQICSQVFC